MILAIVGYILVTVYLLVMAFTRGIYYKVVGAMLIVTGHYIYFLIHVSYHYQQLSLVFGFH